VIVGRISELVAGVRGPSNRSGWQAAHPAAGKEVQLKIFGIALARTAVALGLRVEQRDSFETDAMKFLVLADMDDLWWEHGEGQADVLIACGDLSDDVIRGAAEDFHCKRIFAVKGNHDGIESFPSPIHDLHLNVVEYGGLTFGGLNGSWKYKPRGPFLYEQEEIAAALASFPPVDVFVSHNSPRGIHDKEDGAHYGFDGLLAYIERAKPKLVFHGHQHANMETQIGPTRVIGVYGNRLIDFP